MSKKLDLSKINWLQIIGTVIGIAGFILGGGFLYNEVWKSKVLTYTVLPNYDLGGQSFSGLVIENRGRAPLTDVRIILSGLEAPIGRLNLPGLHEFAEVVRGGEGQTELHIEMPRFSRGAPPLPIYIVTTDTIALQEGKTFFVSSKEVAGTSGEKGTTTIWEPIIVLVIGTVAVSFLIFPRPRTEERLEKIEGQLIIKSARYGATVKGIDYYNDVTDRVRSAIVAGRIDRMPVNNDYFGPDPIKREPKKVIVDYVYAGRDYSRTVPENEKLTLP